MNGLLASFQVIRSMTVGFLSSDLFNRAFKERKKLVRPVFYGGTGTECQTSEENKNNNKQNLGADKTK